MKATAPSLSAVAVTVHPEFARLKRKIIETTGLQYYDDKDAALGECVAHRQRSLKCTIADYFRRVLYSNDPDEFAALIDEITIGETYFFRYPEQFEALRHVLLPDCILRRQRDRRLRIWSAGCASGTEPYSLSILLRDFAHQLQGWQVSVLATDINRRALAQARAGVFTNWDLRTVADDLKHRCFLPSGKNWLIRPEYQKDVEFSRQNLATDLEHFSRANSGFFDIILCRNVMIYFEPELMRRVVFGLRECLAAGGWLLVGHAEPYFEIANLLSPAVAAGITAYRKDGGAGLPSAWRGDWLAGRRATTGSDETAAPFLSTLASIAAAAEAGFPAPAHPWLESEPVNPPAAPVGEWPAQTEKVERAPVVAADLDEVRRHVDAGAWQLALKASNRAVERHPLEAGAYYLHALISEHIGTENTAEKTLGRAIYLDRNFALAHYHLGRCQAHRGAHAAAARSFANALRAIETSDDAAPLPMGDGLSVAELRTIVRLQLDLLERDKR